MQRSHIVLAMAAVFSLTTAAFAQDQQPPSAPEQAAPATTANNSSSGLPSFSDLDKQNHGALSRSDIPKNVEGLKSLRAHFAESDTDHNGRISPSEYAAYAQSQMPASMKPVGQGN
jgi:hypothetical protein